MSEKYTTRDLFGDEVLPLFEAGKSVDWLTEARGIAVSLAQARGEITIDDVRDVLPPPDNADPRIMGAVFKGGDFELVRYVRSMRVTCHRRPVAVFRLK